MSRSSNLWRGLLLWVVMTSVVPAGAAGTCRLEFEDFGGLGEAICAFPLALMSEQPIFFCDPGLFRVSRQLSSTESSPCVLCFHHCVGSWSCREDNRHYGLSAAPLCPKGGWGSVSLLCDEVYIASRKDILCDTYCTTQPDLKPQASEGPWEIMFFHTSDEHFYSVWGMELWEMGTRFEECLCFEIYHFLISWGNGVRVDSLL